VGGEESRRVRCHNELIHVLGHEWASHLEHLCVVPSFPMHSILQILKKKYFLFRDSHLIDIIVCFDRIRGDYQHFVHCDELRVCDRSCICFTVVSLLWMTIWRCGCVSPSAWETFTPCCTASMLASWKSVPYKPGTSRTCRSRQCEHKDGGYVQTHGYIWIPPTHSRF
jgi:hypothetical protein